MNLVFEVIYVYSEFILNSCFFVEFPLRCAIHSTCTCWSQFLTVCYTIPAIRWLTNFSDTQQLKYTLAIPQNEFTYFDGTVSSSSLSMLFISASKWEFRHLQGNLRINTLARRLPIRRGFRGTLWMSLVTRIMNQNLIQQEIKRRLN
jgi:hypothetical protein